MDRSGISIVGGVFAFGAMAVLAGALHGGRVPIKTDTELAAATSRAPSVADRAFEFRMAGNVDSARAFVEQSMVGGRGGTEAMFELSRIHFYLRQFDRAQQIADQVVVAEPLNARGHYWVGLVATYNYVEKARNRETRDQMVTQFTKAAAGYTRAIELDPAYLDARLKLVEFYGNYPEDLGGDSELALLHCRVLEKMDPVYGARARSILMGENLHQERLSMWAQLIRKHGDLAGLYEGLGREFLRVNNLAKAEQVFDKTIKLDPSRSSLLLVLAFHRARKSELAEAEKSVRRYLDSGYKPVIPMRAYAMGYLGRIRDRLGDSAGAVGLTSEARDLDTRFWETASAPPVELFVGIDG